MHAIALTRAYRVSRMVVKRVVHHKRKIRKPMSIRVVPYVIEFVNDQRINIDHIQTVINMCVETEALTFAVRAIQIIMSLQKYVPK